MHLVVPQITLHIILRKILTHVYIVEFLEFEATKFLKNPMSFTTLYVIKLCAALPTCRVWAPGTHKDFHLWLMKPDARGPGTENEVRPSPVLFTVTSSSVQSAWRRKVFSSECTWDTPMNTRTLWRKWAEWVRCLACTATDSWFYLLKILPIKTK